MLSPRDPASHRGRFFHHAGSPRRPTDPQADIERYELTAAVYYAGAWKRALLLECSLEQAMEWGSRLMELPAPVAVKDARDGLGELCNVIAGNLKPLLPPGVGLSTPSVVRSAGYSLRVKRRHPGRVPPFRRSDWRFSRDFDYQLTLPGDPLGSSVAVRQPEGRCAIAVSLSACVALARRGAWPRAYHAHEWPHATSGR